MPDLLSLDDYRDVTPEWLTRALARKFPGTEVTSLFLGTVIHGTSTKVRLLLTYNDAGQAHRLPPTMWLKGGFEPHSPLRARIYAGEAAFYRDVSELLDIGCAKTYFAEVDDEGARSLILMEDLLARGATFGRATRPVTPDQAARILSVLAKMHARFWRDDAIDAYPWLMNGGALGASNIIAKHFGQENWDRCLGLPRAVHIPEALRDRTRMGALVDRMMREDREKAFCFVHGDTHIGNTFWEPDGACGYVDWATPMKGHWAHDVSDFISGGLTIEDRRRSDRDLIRHYIGELASHGVEAPSFDDAWFEYRRHIIYNFGAAICAPELQPEDVCTVSAERVCAAILDLETLKAWED